MSTPGWYPDPQDPNQLRYYDGQSWTQHQHPAQAQQGAQPADTQYQPPAWGAQGGQQQPTQAWQAQPGQSAWGAGAAGAGWQQQQQYPQPQPAQRSKKKVPLIVGLVVVVVAGLVTGGYFLFFNSSSAPEFTYAGKEIKDPAAVLASTQQDLRSVVKQRHGVMSKNSRCYYALPKEPDKGDKGSDAKDSDVGKDLYCGPVLFVDGDASQPYLKFGLNSEQENGKAVLSARSKPESDDPTAVPDSVELKRPDGVSPPKGADGLTAPAPPPADKNVILATTLTDVSIPDAPESALMRSYNGGIRITKLGTIKRYGHGDDARSAPAGQKLIAFQTAGATGVETSQNLTDEAKISVDGGPGEPVPELSDGEYVVVAAPESARSVDLVLDDAGLTQSLSLLDGKPGKDNVLVFARDNLEGKTPISSKTVLTFKPKVRFSDGTSGSSERATVTVNTVELMYKTPPYEKPVTASSPSKALMHVSVTYKGAHESGEYGFPSSMLTFTPDGGSATKARNLSPRENKLYNTFEVPGDVTSGTLTVSGSVKQSFSDGDGSYRFGVKSPLKIKISIPLGD